MEELYEGTPYDENLNKDILINLCIISACLYMEYKNSQTNAQIVWVINH